MTDTYDAIIIGAGPAGAASAIILAGSGQRVLVLEKEPFPRFRVGESLSTFVPAYLDELGVLDQVMAENQIEKRGAEFIRQDAVFKLFYPKRGDDESIIPQMSRDRFDNILIEQAKRKGTIVKHGVMVDSVLFEGNVAVGVAYRVNRSSVEKRVYGTWIIDASGYPSVMDRKLKANKVFDPAFPNKFAIYSHWAGPIPNTRCESEMNVKICVHQNNRDWGWYLPIGEELLSVGVVIQKAGKSQHSGSMERLFQEALRRMPFLGWALNEKNGMIQTQPFRACRVTNYRSKKYFGAGWVLVGDSAGFVDPMLASGVQCALKSGLEVGKILGSVSHSFQYIEERLKEYYLALDDYYQVNSAFVRLLYTWQMDFRNARKLRYHLHRFHWDSWNSLATFCWHHLRVKSSHSKQREQWLDDILRGEMRRPNAIVDLCRCISTSTQMRRGEIGEAVGARPTRFAITNDSRMRE